MERTGPDAPVAALWELYAHSRNSELRSKLIAHYLPFAQRIAARLYRVRVSDATPFDDYLQYARLGLIEAVDRFDHARNIEFEAYASHRVRGAILNGLRRETEKAARYNQGGRHLESRVASLSEEIVPVPAEAELSDIASLVVGLGIGLLLEPEELTDDTPAANPYTQAVLSQMRSMIRQLLMQLPARERQILELHYYRHHPFNDIAEQMGVTKGRVSQLHARALLQLRALIGDRSGIDRSL